MGTATTVPSEGTFGAVKLLIVKLPCDGGDETWSVSVVLCASTPLVPVTVNDGEPLAIALVVSIRNWTAPPPLMVEPDGKVAVAPDGRPETAKETLPVKPLLGAT